jgi:hypothetical protein
MDTTTETKKTDKRTAEGLRLTPPRMTKAEWAKRSQTSVTLSRSDLEQLAQLVSIGRQVMRDSRPVSANLKAAMSRLGVSTHGL